VILIKKLSSLESPLQILIINNSIGSVLSLAAASFFWVVPTPRQWIELVALGVIMVSAQFLFIQSMKSGDASYVLPFSYMTLVFGAAYDFFIFSTQPDWISHVGAATIVSGAILLGTREVLKKA
jgi:drug/metabolite transporter (DMT)-like permease